MIESSRLFLFTEYARKGCGVIDEHGTDYKVWEALPVRRNAQYGVAVKLTPYRIDSRQIREPKNCLLG
jgi:hypothetical protein